MLIVGIAVYGFVQQAPKYFSIGKFSSSEISTSDIAIEKAFKNGQSDIQIGGSGKVIKILRDDTQGSRHQRFIVELNSGQSLAATIKEIFSLGRRYPWRKPEHCPCCGGRRVWGHGYVLAFFDGFTEGLGLRRYRCPE
jgi:hypothetical protein